MPFLYTAYTGNNDELIKAVANFYLKDGDTVADPTFGKGVFWKKIDTTKYKFFPSDLKTCPQAPYDFRKLPYETGTFDAVIFDPPYCHNPGNMMINDNYQNKETTKGMYHNDIIKLYLEGIMEAKRILKNEGQLWVKCKDEIESGFQRWSHTELKEIAEKLGFYTKDFFILVQKMNPIVQIKIQQHARKNHSYLWVFKKPNKKEERFLSFHS